MPVLVELKPFFQIAHHHAEDLTIYERKQIDEGQDPDDVPGVALLGVGGIALFSCHGAPGGGREFLEGLEVTRSASEAWELTGLLEALPSQGRSSYVPSSLIQMFR